MVNHLSETSHPLSSSALRLYGSVADPSSIFRTHFQVPYPASPLFVDSYENTGVYGYSSHSGTTLPVSSRASRRGICFFLLATRHFLSQCLFHGRDYDLTNALAKNGHIFLRQTFGFDGVMEVDSRLRRPQEPMPGRVRRARTH